MKEVWILTECMSFLAVQNAEPADIEMFIESIIYILYEQQFNIVDDICSHLYIYNIYNI